MEYKYLAKLTHKKEYFQKVGLHISNLQLLKQLQVDHIMTVLERNQKANGLWPTFWNTTTGEPINSESFSTRRNHATHQVQAHYSVGAWSDSAVSDLTFRSEGHSHHQAVRIPAQTVSDEQPHREAITPAM
jgi:hypothetical protein